MATDKLSDVALRSIKPRDKQFKLSDGGGLFLLVNPQGSRLWRLAYRFGGRQKALALGSYPATSLSEAREARRKAKGLLEAGTDPGQEKKKRKAAVRAAEAAAENTFAAVAEKYLTKAEKEGRAAVTIGKARWLLNDLAAGLADKLVHEIAPKDVLAVLRPIEARGNYETARRMRSTIGLVLRFAVANGWAERDATADLKGALIAPNVRHRAAIVKPEPLGVLMRAIYSWEGGQPTTVAALKLMALLALRPGEVRGARWDEIDFEKRTWTVPLERMKMRRVHATPLPDQAVAILKELRPLTVRGEGSLIFPSTTSSKVPISENTTTLAMRRLGFGPDQMTSHGFRAAFATLANESGKWSVDSIERQLAHVEGNAVRRAYARGQYWDERVVMMQWWADYLDQLREQAKYTPRQDKRKAMRR